MHLFQKHVECNEEEIFDPHGCRGCDITGKHRGEEEEEDIHIAEGVAEGRRKEAATHGN